MKSRDRRPRLRSIVAFSIGYEREPLLRRGLGIEHLTELVRRLARPIVIEGRSIAYGGNWKKIPGNFTRTLLDIISAEQDDLIDPSGDDPDLPRHIAPLINHLAWPHYLEVDARTEAECVHSCRILRITQRLAGIPDPCPDAEAELESDVAVLNQALTMSAMRRLQVDGMTIQPVEDQTPEEIPPIAARICLGGKVHGSKGFIPGIFEESLLMLEAGRPLLLLGGFGGATESVASAFLEPATAARVFDPIRLEEDVRLARLAAIVAGRPAIYGGLTTRPLCDRLRIKATSGTALSTLFGTAPTLSDEETRRLMTTSDMDEAVSLSLRVIKSLPKPT